MPYDNTYTFKTDNNIVMELTRRHILSLAYNHRSKNIKTK